MELLGLQTPMPSKSPKTPDHRSPEPSVHIQFLWIGNITGQCLASCQTLLEAYILIAFRVKGKPSFWAQ